MSGFFRRPIRLLRGLGMVLGLAGAFPFIVSSTRALEQSVVVENIKIGVSVPGESLPNFGFTPVRLVVENRQARDLHWDVTFRSNEWNGEPSVSQWSTRLVIPASRTSERWVYVPSSAGGLATRLGYYGPSGNLTAAFSGTGIRPVNIAVTGRVAGGAGIMVPWAVSSSLQTAVRSQISALLSQRTPPPGSRGRPGAWLTQDVAPFDLAQLPADWRVWSRFARVVLSESEYAALPAPQRAALRNWVALGGELYLMPAVSRSAVERESFGAGSIVKHDRSLADQAKLGGVFGPSTLSQTTLSQPSADDGFLQKSGLSGKIPRAKKVGDWMAYFFVGFALMVGPVNLFFFAPPKRRQRLFFSVPLISLGGVFLLMTAIWLQDGVGGEGARRALVVLLPGDNQAAVFQEQISRSGLLFGTSFSLPDDTVCASLPVEESASMSGRSLVYEREGDQAGGDWFCSRARQAQHLRRLTPTRARVEQVGTAPDGAPIVQSSVAGTLRDFYYRKDDGWWEAHEVPPGTRVTLARAKSEPRGAKGMGEFANACSVQFGRLVRESGADTSGHFFAMAGDFDLAPIRTFEGIRWRDSKTLVTGVLESTSPARKGTP